MGSSDRERAVETRTKICSSCKERLAWEATWCKHCGAGRPPSTEVEIEESWFERKIRPHLPRREWLAIGGAVLLLLIGGVFVLRHSSDKAATIEGLQAERTTVVERIEELSTKKAGIMEEALALKRRARKEEAAAKYTAADTTTAEAERLLTEVDGLSAQLDPLTRRLRELDTELSALGADD